MSVPHLFLEGVIPRRTEEQRTAGGMDSSAGRAWKARANGGEYQSAAVAHPVETG